MKQPLRRVEIWRDGNEKRKKLGTGEEWAKEGLMVRDQT